MREDDDITVKNGKFTIGKLSSPRLKQKYINIFPQWWPSVISNEQEQKYFHEQKMLLHTYYILINTDL